MGPHVPELPLDFRDPSHDSHAPSHSLSQQNPSTQNPLPHSLACWHDWLSPFFGAHAPPSAQ
jgi:hypothetical protein